MRDIELAESKRLASNFY